MDTLPTDYQFPHRHIFGIEQLSAADISHILSTARSFKEIASWPIKKVPTLRGKSVVNFFFEPLTRTRLPRAEILDLVVNGVAVGMVLLYLVLGGGKTNDGQGENG